MTELTLAKNENKEIDALVESAVEYAKDSLAKNTTLAYRAALSEKPEDNKRARRQRKFPAFESWCMSHGAQPLPADSRTVVAYLAALAKAGAKFSTIGVRRAAISAAHQTAHYPDPTATEEVKLVMKGIVKKIGVAPEKKEPLKVDDVRKVIGGLPDDLRGRRDKALILVGFSGAFRRSELVAIDVKDMRLSGDLKITVRRSKTDQEGKGFVKVIPSLTDTSLCPVTAMREWLDAAGIKSGAVFRRIDRWGKARATRLTPQSVALILKAAAGAVGIDPRQFAGHSLRSGFITSAAIAEIESRDIMAVSGHKSEHTMRGYIQDAGVAPKRAIKTVFGETSREK